MLTNAYLLAKICADTAENEQHFVEILPIGRRVAEPDRPDPQPPRGRGAVRANGRALALAPAALHADRACVLAAAQPLALFSNMH